MKRFLFGLLWAVVFYFVFCAVVGGIAGGQAGGKLKDSRAASAAGAKAGAEATQRWLPSILGGSVVLAAVGSVAGILPGTKAPKSPDDA